MSIRLIGVVSTALLCMAVISGCAPEGDSASNTPTSQRPTPTPSPTPTASCAERMVADLTPDEQAGQLIMVGLASNEASTSLDSLIARYHVGGVVLLGGWSGGVSSVRTTTDHLHATGDSAPGVLIAADQEGGQVQQLTGDGFSRIPSAVEQGELDPQALQSKAAIWAAQMKDAGVDLDLAPVADTVPADLGRGNAPIGALDRQFSNDPAVVATHVAAVVRGADAAGIGTTLKHFPGLGRVTGNTDNTASGIVDDATTSVDPYLQPFADGIAAGAPAVMVSSATYTRIDAKHQAVFSPTVITDLLRGSMGFTGVVVSDDIGVAASVSSTPVDERATEFVSAGGDLALTAAPDAVTPFHDSLVAAMSDPAFADKVTAAAARVIQLKVDLGLATCG